MDLEIHDKMALFGKKKTKKVKEFEQMRDSFKGRVTIVSEGDSWFAYPPKWIVAGKPSNLISHISKSTQEKANFLTLASNGDEAIAMISGKQKHELIEILRWHTKDSDRKPVDLLLFSGGGNDVVGENDFERFIHTYNDSFVTGKQCVNMERLNRKVKQIGLAYQELLDIRDDYSPDTIIITHTYDYPQPSLTGGVFLGGLIKTKGWMKRFMDEAGIKEKLQADVIKVFMDAMAEEILEVAEKRNGLIVVDSRGTLQGDNEWLNEIHPTSSGFKKISKQIIASMESAFPALK